MKKKKGKAKSKAKAKTKAKTKTKLKARKPAKKSVKAKSSSKKKKVSNKKAAKGKGPHPRPGIIAPANSVLLGYVEDYFAKIGVIALTLLKGMTVGSRLHVLGHTTNFEQTVDSMQIDHQSVSQAGPKDAVGIKVTARTRRGDHVYLIR